MPGFDGPSAARVGAAVRRSERADRGRGNRTAGGRVAGPVADQRGFAVRVDGPAEAGLYPARVVDLVYAPGGPSGAVSWSDAPDVGDCYAVALSGELDVGRRYTGLVLSDLDGKPIFGVDPAGSGGPAADADLTLHVDTWDEATHSGTAQIARYEFRPVPDDLNLTWNVPDPVGGAAYGRAALIDLRGNDLEVGKRYRTFRVGAFTDRQGVARFGGRSLYCAYMGATDVDCENGEPVAVF